MDEGVPRSGGGRGVGRRARPAPAPARDPAQLPGGRARPLPARADRPGAAPVHRRRQRRGAAVQPRPAPLGLRVGEAARTTTSGSAPTTTSSTAPATSIIKHRDLRPGGPADGAATAADRRGCRARRCSAAARGRQHAFRPDSVVNISGMSFGSLSGQRRRGAQPRRRARGLPAEHRRGRHLAVPPQRRRAGLPDRHRLLRLPRRARPVRPRPLQGHGRRRHRCARWRSSSARAPSPASAGCCPAAKVSAEIAATRGVPQGVDCVSPSRHAEFPDVDGMLDWVEMLAAETGLPVGIKSAVGDLAFWHELAELMARHGPRGRLRHDRRRRGRHRRGAAGLHRLGVAAVPARASARVYADLRRGRAARATSSSSARASSACRTTPWSRSRSAPTWSTWPARRCSPSAASRRRSATPTPARPESRRRTRGSRTGSTRAQVGALRQLRQDAAPRPAQGRRGLRRRAPRADRCPTHRDPRRANRGDAAARGLRLRARVGLPVDGGPEGDRPAHAGDRAGGSPRRELPRPPPDQHRRHRLDRPGARPGRRSGRTARSRPAGRSHPGPAHTVTPATAGPRSGSRRSRPARPPAPARPPQRPDRAGGDPCRAR